VQQVGKNPAKFQADLYFMCSPACFCLMFSDMVLADEVLSLLLLLLYGLSTSPHPCSERSL
jgi:hypothetical protein